jgi:hypothetical protein
MEPNLSDAQFVEAIPPSRPRANRLNARMRAVFSQFTNVDL